MIHMLIGATAPYDIAAAHHLGDLHATLSSLVETHGGGDVVWMLGVVLDDASNAGGAEGTRCELAARRLEAVHVAAFGPVPQDATPGALEYGEHAVSVALGKTGPQVEARLGLAHGTWEAWGAAAALEVIAHALREPR